MKAGHRFILAQRICFAAIASLGFAAMAVGGGLGVAGAAAGAIAVLASLWHGRPRLPDRVWVGVQVAFLLWIGSQVLAGTHVLSVFGSLLIFVQVHRLMSRKRTRDDLYCAFIAFGQVLLASVLTVDAMFFVVFMAFVFFVIQGLLLSRMALSAEAAWEAARGLPKTGPTPVRAYAPLDSIIRLRLVVATTALATLIQAGTLLLFFVLPRAQAAMLSGLVSPLHVSGFSDRVRLGSVGTMQLSKEPVMRVRAWTPEGSTFPSVGSLYWRGLALDRFDGRGWELSDVRRTTLTTRGNQRSAPPPTRKPWILHAEVTLEPLDSQVLFHVASAAGIYGDFSELEAVETAGFYVPGPLSRRTYRVYADPRQPEPEQLRNLDPRSAPSSLQSRYTQLPVNLSERVGELAELWSAGAATPLDEILLLQGKLRSFDYSLDQEPSRYPDPLLAFLDDVQEGHCEYFASGLAVMLRTRGIPSRIVNGFAGADWNAPGEYWVVRQMHAHSWVEVWFPEQGWVLFDPTPEREGGVQESAELTWLAQLRAWSDVGSVAWSRVMLDYGLDTQARGLRRGMESLGQLTTGRKTIASLFSLNSPDDSSPSSNVLHALAAVVTCLGAFAIGVWCLVLYRRDKSPIARARRLAEKLQQSWSKALPTPATETRPTLLALAEEASKLDPETFGEAPALIARYFAARFGHASISRQDLRLLRALAGRKGRLRVRAPRPKPVP